MVVPCFSNYGFAFTCNYALIITRQSQNLSALFILHFYGYSVYVFYSQVSKTSTFIFVCFFLLLLNGLKG